MKKISVIGSGAWGTALANLIANNSHQVTLLTHSESTANEINQNHSNQKHLPNQPLNPKLHAIAGLSPDTLQQSQVIFLVTPSTFVQETLQKLNQLNLKSDTSFVLCSKGLEATSLKFFSEIFHEIFPQNNFAILSGPNFAGEVAAGVPTITTIASASEKLFHEIKNILNNNHLSCSYTSDVTTTEICGTVKNILAIGCGILDGLNLGENAKAALVTCGISEIITLSQKISKKNLEKSLGKNLESFISPDLATAAGFGDIFLTCSTKKSRNNSLGYEIAKGKTYAEISKISNKTYEGAIAADSITKLAHRLKIKLTLCETIHEILTKNLPSPEIRQKITTIILKNPN